MSDNKGSSKEISPVKRALAAMQKMRARIEDLESREREPIAVVGMGCRLPGGVESPDDYWKLLEDGVDAIREVPEDRYDLDDYFDPDQNAPGRIYSRWGGFLDQVDQFDASFFGINPREATNLDPQQRLVLEVAYEAFQNAGYTRESIAGVRAGVYVGVYARDYGQLTHANIDLIDPYTSTGDAPGFGANRLSFTFDLKGPSVGVNSSCASSLATIHFGCQALRVRECDMAVAGGVNLHLTPMMTLGISRLRALSPDGRCMTFDSRANGFVRGEGCGLVVLKRLSDALADRDRVLGVILGSAVNQNGRGVGLTQPNMQAQKDVLTRASRFAGIAPADVGYVEAHGTGTELGDPIEVDAITSVYGQGRTAEKPLVLGAVKTNIGHLETAAGVAGFMKTVLSLRNNRIPRNLHFENLNPHITLDTSKYIIPTETREWKQSDTPRYAGVSSFGLGGTNAHIIVSDAPEEPEHDDDVPDAFIRREDVVFLPVTAHNSEALRIMAGRYRDFLRETNHDLYEIAYNATLRRDQHLHRVCIAGTSKEGLADLLDDFLNGKAAGVHSGEVNPRRKRKAAFVLSSTVNGMPGIREEDLAALPVLRETLEAWDISLQQLLNNNSKSLLNYCTNAPADRDPDLDRYAVAALQAALGAVLRQAGVQPLMMMGQGAAGAGAALALSGTSPDDALQFVRDHGDDDGVFSFAGKISPSELRLSGEELTDSVRQAVEDGHDLFIDLSPDAGHQSVLAEEAAKMEQPGVAVGLSLAGSHCTAAAMDALAALHAAGAPVKLAGLFPRFARHVDLPLHAWTRDRYWIDVDFRDAVVGENVERKSTARKKDAGRTMTWDEAVANPNAKTGKSDVPRILALSAPDAKALNKQAALYRQWLQGRNDAAAFEELCCTAARKRDPKQFRMTIVGNSGDELSEHLAEALEGASSPYVSRGEVRPGKHRVVFAFSGQGSQWPGMGTALLEQEPVFRAKVEEIDRLLREHTGWSIIDELRRPAEESRLSETEVAQPAIFALQVGLVETLAHYGVRPHALVGHSVGEVAAAHAAGVLALADAVRVIYHRSRVMQKATGLGRMAAAGIPLEEARRRIAGKEDRIAVGAHNSPNSVVFSGEEEAVQAVVDGLPEGVFKMMLPVNYAFHSPQMESFKEELQEALRGLPVSEPLLPIVSTVTGEAAATGDFGAAYWPRNMREAVSFAPAIRTLAEEESDLFIEIGPHNVLTVPIEQTLQEGGFDGLAVPTLRRKVDDFRMTRAALGRIHCAGYDIRWERLLPEGRNLQLPVDDGGAEEERGPGIKDWLYETTWQSKAREGEHRAAILNWLILCDGRGVGKALATLAEAAGGRAVLVFPGEEFQKLDRDQYELNPASRDDFVGLRDDLIQVEPDTPFTMVNLWGLDPLAPEDITPETIALVHDLVLMSTTHAIQSQDAVPTDHRPRVFLVTEGAQRIGDEVPSSLIESAVWGFARAVAVEHSLIWGGLVDLEAGIDPAKAAELLFVELQSDDDEDYVALRGGDRYVARLHAITGLEPASAEVRADAGYLVTGGLTGIGLLVARWLIEKGARHLVLLGRTPLPPREDWDGDHRESVKDRIQALRHLESLGESLGGEKIEIVTAAVDTADEDSFNDFLKEYNANHPPLRGVIHSAGVLEGRSVMDLDADALHKVLRPKVNGGWVLHKCLADTELDFFVLFSSVSGAVTGLADGLANYAASNAFLDALAHYRRSLGLPATSIVWGPWADTGFAAQSDTGSRMIANLLSRGIHALSSRRGLAVLEASIVHQLAVPVAIKIDWDRFQATMKEPAASPLYRDILASRISVAPAKSSARELDSGQPFSLAVLAKTPEDQRGAMLQGYIAKNVAEIMRYPVSRLEPGRSLKEIGIDSLMGVELQSRVRRDLDYELSAGRITDGSSIAQLSIYILKNLDIPEAAGGFTFEEFPLSPEQESAYFMDRVAPGANITNVHVAYIVGAELSGNQVSSALETLTKRYEFLRTSVASKVGVAVQRIYSGAAPDFEIVDTEELSEEEILDSLIARAQEGFTVSRSPLVRVRLFPLASGSILLIAAHTVILDETAIRAFGQELLDLLAGTDSGAAAYPTPYREYAAARTVTDANLRFWKEYLQGDLPAVRLPTARSIPPLRNFRTETVGFDVPVEAFSGSAPKDELPVIVSAAAALLHRVTGLTDLPLGVYRRMSPVQPDVPLGPLTNLFVLRVGVSGDQSISVLQQNIREDLQRIEPHANVPFLQVVRELNPLRDPSRSPLVQFAFVFEEESRSLPDGLDIDVLDLDRTAGFDDIVVMIRRGDDGLRIDLRYKTELYARTTMEHFAASYAEILKSAGQAPKTSVDGLNLHAVPVSEELQAVRQREAAPEAVPHHGLLTDLEAKGVLIHELVANMARLVPGAIAAVDGEQKFTYADLDERAGQVADHLTEQGIPAGAVVAVAGDRSFAFLAAVLGILKVGGTVLPLDPEYSVARMSVFMHDADPFKLITFAEQDIRGPEDFANQRMVLELRTGQFVVAEAARGKKKASKKKAAKKKAAKTAKSVKVPANPTAFLFYRAHDQVKPLGVEVDHASFVHSLMYTIRNSPLSLGARTLLHNSVSSSVLFHEAFATLATGGTVVIAPQKSRQDMEFVKFLKDHFVERIFADQGVLRGIARVAHEQDLVPQYLREVHLVGSRISITRQLVEMLEKLGYCEVNYRFGTFETGLFAAYRLKDFRSLDWPDYPPIGRPIDDMEAYILDDQMQPAALEFVGELYVGGPGLASGYRNEKKMTGERFVKSPFSKAKDARLFRTGLLARYNASGEIQLLGSRERTAGIEGRDINLRELELAIEEHPAITQAYVTQNQELAGNGLVAYIVSDRIVDRLITTIHCHVEYGDSQRITLVTQDVSPGGLRLQGVPADWKVGMHLRITLLLPGFFDEFRVGGEVRWIEDGLAGVGFQTSPVEASLLKKSLAYLLELEQFTLAHESQMPRIPIRRRCTVEMEDGRRFEMTAGEISTTGVSILDAPVAWEKDMRMRILLSLPGIIDPLKLECWLAWRDDTNRTGFNFEPDEATLELLQEFTLHFKEHQQLSITQLRTFLQSRLPYFLIPLNFVILDSLPELPDGSVNETALRFPGSGAGALESEGTEHGKKYFETEQSFVSPRTSIEGVIQTVWIDVLQREYGEVGIYNNFFDLGGDSLTAFVVAARLSEEMDIDLPVSSVYLAPSISELGKIVLQKKAQKEKDLELNEALMALEEMSQEDLKEIVRSQLLEDEAENE